MAKLADLHAYLTRIGLEGTPTLADLHQAHATSIPFENLDPANGTPNSLELSDLEDKLVRRRRGGYCFEQNLLFKAAIETLGIGRVEPMLARVRMGNRGELRPRTHLVLRVTTDDGLWHADVGFGSDGLLRPIPFGPGPEVEQSGWRYRVVDDGPDLVLQLWWDGAWVDLYAFVPEEAPRIDIEVSNWYTCTHPISPFVTGLFIAAQQPGRRWTLMARGGTGSLTERTPAGETVTPVVEADLPSVLKSRFGLSPS
jgi:N-hydroxyarylamine O-acetyltransferase